MKSLAPLGAAALGLCLAAVPDVSAWEMIPLKVKFTLRLDVSPHHQPDSPYPWWTYFPYDPHLMQPASAPAYPHWTGPQPAPTAAAPRLPANVPNIAWQPVPNPVQPAGYQPAYGIWFGR